ncbi:MAG TPA: HU family DNA-binding protein [Mycobacteriales bacterium]|nr:HU family DNA-binding protein [Mycobacteriales bacterium]
MNKAQLVDALTERFGGDKKQATTAVDGLIDTIVRAVSKGEKVAITGFGVFEKRDRAARIARNPATGEKVRVKKTSVPAFRAGQGFKDVVSGAKKLPKVTAKSSAAAKKAAKTTTTRSTAKAPAKTARPAGAKAASRGTVKKAATKAPAGKKTATKAPAKKSSARKSTRGK